jgi:hypothetical protein
MMKGKREENEEGTSESETNGVRESAKTRRST